MIHSWATFITFNFSVSCIFRSDNWLIHVSWVIYYMLININVDSCRVLQCRTQLWMWSTEKVSSMARKKKMRRIQKVIKVLNCISFCYLGVLLFEYLISITFQCTGHLENILPLSPCLPYFLSAACCLSIDVAHPKRNNTASSRRWQWCMSLMGKHFSGVVIIKSFFFP